MPAGAFVIERKIKDPESVLCIRYLEYLVHCRRGLLHFKTNSITIPFTNTKDLLMRVNVDLWHRQNCIEARNRADRVLLFISRSVCNSGADCTCHGARPLPLSTELENSSSFNSLQLLTINAFSISITAIL